MSTQSEFNTFILDVQDSLLDAGIDNDMASACIDELIDKAARRCTGAPWYGETDISYQCNSAAEIKYGF